MLFFTFLFTPAAGELDMGGFLTTDSFCFFKLLFPIKASRSSVGSSSKAKPYLSIALKSLQIIRLI